MRVYMLVNVTDSCASVYTAYTSAMTSQSWEQGHRKFISYHYRYYHLCLDFSDFV